MTLSFTEDCYHKVGEHKMEIDCLKCINSACCKLSVEVDKEEYNRFTRLNLDKHFDTRTDIFVKKNPIRSLIQCIKITLQY